MPFLQTPKDRAGVLIFALAIGIIVALTPFLSGLLGAAVLYVICLKPYRWLARWSKPGIAASAILLAAILVIALPLTWLIGIVIDQAPDALRRVQSSGVYARVAALHIGTMPIGA
ncbi:MAG TPA: hypothetical protein VFD67_06925, partial [Gemmatimonadaceae bacterium]|nr:hypothetical protein [Gemmatimonadaceae bacterium]